MKRVLLGLIIGLALFGSTTMAADAPTPLVSTGSIVVHLSEYVPTHGMIVVSLAREKSEFVSAEVPVFRQAEFNPSGNSKSISFENIPFGEYAVKAYQDRNASKKLENVVGFPQEPTGYSNYHSGMLPPPFKKAKFSHQASTTPVHVIIRNFKK